MQLAGPAVGSDASPVKNPEGCVGHLLDLRQQDPSADGVDGSRLDHDAIAGSSRETMQEWLDLPILDGRLELLAGDARPQPRVDQAARLGVHNHPGLGLAVVTGQAFSLFVVGMDLDRQDLAGVDELDQKRELAPARQARPQNFRAAMVHQVAQGGPGEFSLVDDAHGVAIVRQFPALGIVVALADRLVQHRSQPTAPPDESPEDRFEPQGIE